MTSVFANLIETEAEEVARLGQATEGSIYHFLSTLPVTIDQNPEGLIITLPQQFPDQGEITVVAISRRPPLSDPRDFDDNGKRITKYRHDNHFVCVVIESTDVRYRRGGHNLSISEAELRRGTLRTLTLKENS